MGFTSQVGSSCPAPATRPPIPPIPPIPPMHRPTHRVGLGQLRLEVGGRHLPQDVQVVPGRLGGGRVGIGAAKGDHRVAAAGRELHQGCIALVTQVQHLGGRNNVMGGSGQGGKKGRQEGRQVSVGSHQLTSRESYATGLSARFCGRLGHQIPKPRPPACPSICLPTCPTTPPTPPHPPAAGPPAGTSAAAAARRAAQRRPAPQRAGAAGPCRFIQMKASKQEGRQA